MVGLGNLLILRIAANPFKGHLWLVWDPVALLELEVEGGSRVTLHDHQFVGPCVCAVVRFSCGQNGCRMAMMVVWLCVAQLLLHLSTAACVNATSTTSFAHNRIEGVLSGTCCGDDTCPEAFVAQANGWRGDLGK